MKLGLFMMPVHPPEKDRTECFEEDLELIVRADELGYTEAVIGQHHSVAWECPGGKRQPGIDYLCAGLVADIGDDCRNPIQREAVRR